MTTLIDFVGKTQFGRLSDDKKDIQLGPFKAEKMLYQQWKPKQEYLNWRTDGTFIFVTYINRAKLRQTANGFPVWDYKHVV
jgi:hypothetical protein